MRRTFRWKRCLVLLAVFAVLGGGVFALNRVQARKQASVIKAVAEKSAAAIDGDKTRRAEAIGHYELYIKFQPQDEEARLKLARLLFEQVKDDPKTFPKAAAGVEQFLIKFPDHPDVRRDLARLYLENARIRSSRQHIEMLFNSPKGDYRQDAELLEMMAQCEEVSGELTKAIDFLEQAIKAETGPLPVRVRIYEQALNLLNRNQEDTLREAKIANHLRTLLEKEPFRSDISARVAAARFEMSRKELENARRDIEYALKVLPGGATNPEALLAAAQLEVRSTGEVKARLVAAREHLEKAFAVDKKNVPVGVMLAEVLAAQGDMPGAVNVLRTAAEALGQVNDQYCALVDRLIDLGNEDTAAALTERVEAAGDLKPMAAYFRGRLALMKSDWATARKLLEEAQPNLNKLPEFRKRALVGLARVYEVLQNPDKQLEYCQQALSADTEFVPALVGEADALAKLGRLTDAIFHAPTPNKYPAQGGYQTLVTRFQLAHLRPTLARLRLTEQLRKAPENRNWARFDSEDTLGPEADRPDELQLLYAQGLAARGEREKAIKVIEAVLAKDKNNPTAAAALVSLARIREAVKPGTGAGVLDEADEALRNTVEVRLARAEVLMFRAKPPAAAEFELLAAGADKLKPADQYRLWLGLAQAAMNAAPRAPEGEPRNAMREAALRFFRRAAEADPRDLLSRAALVDIGLTAQKQDVVDAAIAELAALEGPDGPIGTLGKVVVALPEVKNITDTAARTARLAELRRLAQGVKAQRPGWSRVHVALGRIDEMEGHTDDALKNYKQAIDAGEREEYVIRRAVEIYRQQRKDRDAAGMLEELSTRMALPDDLERFKAIHQMLGRVVRPEDRATVDRIAPMDFPDRKSTDPNGHRDPKLLMLRGALLAAMRDDVAALAAYRRATEVTNPPLPETFAALIGQLVRTNQWADARQALAEAERVLTAAPQKTNTARAELLVTLAGCHELVGDAKAAEARYREAVKVAPQDMAPNRRLIEFLMRTGQSAEAEKMLTQMTQAADLDVAHWARRYLSSVALLSRPDAYQQRVRALSLIDQNLARGQDPEDIKARAVIQTVDPQQRAEGMRILKEYWGKGGLTPDEAYLLGRLTFDLGPSKIPESVPYFESAAQPRPGMSLEHLAGLIRVYLALNAIGDARAVLERLKIAAPNSWEAAREEARLLKRESREAALTGDKDSADKLAAEARDRILKFPGQDDPATIRFRTGPLLEELGFAADAEAAYRKLLSLTDTAAPHLPLAILFLHGKRAAEALALAWEREPKSPVLVTARLLTGAVRAKRPGAAEEAKIGQWLDAKIAEYTGKPEASGLIAAKAELLDAQEKYNEAIAEYRRALAAGRSDLVVNNLAMLLAMHDRGRVDEAIKMMDDLIALRGPAPTYLDTRAVLSIVKGGDAVASAVQDLEMALLQQVRPAYLFHLAWAYDLQNKRGEREKKLDEAKRSGLTAADLHPLEVGKYRELLGPDAK